MGKRLTEVQVDSFREHGFLPGIDVFGEDECDAFRSRVEAFERARPQAIGWAFDIKTNLLFDWVYESSCAPRLLDAIEDLIRPDVLLTNSIFRIKEPGSATARQSTGTGSGQLVRGEDRWGHFGAEPVPVGTCTAEDVLARRRILNAYPENVLMGPLGPDGVVSFADEPVAGR